ncbi:RND family efflux transporter, MFP subunit [Abditibacterium utsteinense]|uniref:RND family efflux transporter, MFP subunit n=1 Tax=Abditibacterium utsteinense TaxID=1960156 RepID=A0A2S8SPV7_9BACT|nr:efflux RND transporter periplasmic adaptor subunit [Abditibacterium utsteinense]PQV62814.1 RND family efflux transporter, MFP subunit [Abditibacterium utsteinense]
MKKLVVSLQSAGLFAALCISTFPAFAQGLPASAGPYRLEVSSAPNPIPLGQAQIEVRVKTASGTPVEGAKVRVLTQMPGMAMGERTQNAAPVAGKSGVYRSSANFQMAGQWAINVEVDGPQGAGKASIPVSPGTNTLGAGTRKSALWGAALLAILLSIVALRRRENRARFASALKPGVIGAVLTLAALFFGARYAVSHFRRPGSMSVIEAQAMDMSVMKPPVGAVPVEVATVLSGQVRARVSYSGSVLAFNEAQIAPRVTGRIIAMPVYPGDRVTRGQLLVRLDSDELRAKENGARFARQSAAQDRLIAQDETDSARAAQNQARAEAERAAGMSEEGQAQIRLAQANARGAVAEIEAARRGVLAAQSEARAADAEKRIAQAEIGDAGAVLAQSRGEVENARALVVQAQQRLPQAQAEVTAARADLEFAKNKRDRSAFLLKEGAISREEFQADDAALTSAQSKLNAAGAKVREASGDTAAAQANVQQANAKVRSAQAKLGGTRAAIARSDAGIAAASEKVAQMRVAVETARAKASGSQAEIAAARARLSQSQSGVGIAAAQSQGAGASVSKARNQAARADAMANQAEAALSEATTVRGYTEIRAENDGVVTKRVMAPGSLVNPGQTLLEIQQISRLRFQASVAQSDLDAVRVGSPVSIRSATNPAKKLQTTVSAVFPAADAGSRTGIIEAIAPNPDNRFKPGESIVMDIATSQSSSGALKVPTESLVMSADAKTDAGGAQTIALGETASVWLMERATSDESKADSGAFQARLARVKTGASDGDFTEILGGIPDGAKVITRGYDDLKDGDAVVVAKFGADGPLELPAASQDAGTGKAMPGMKMPENSAPADSMAGMRMNAPDSTKNEGNHTTVKANPTKNEAISTKNEEIRVSVDGSGFTPPNFALKKGVKTRLTFTRTTDATCATEIVWPDFKIREKLPLNVPVTLEITPKTSGTSSFACGMNMLKGTAVIR